MTTPASPGQDPAGRRGDRQPAAPAGRYPAAGRSATTAAAMRAAADLIDRSGIAGLSVTCSGRHISVQVPRSSGNAQSRAAAVARLAGYPHPAAGAALRSAASAPRAVQPRASTVRKPLESAHPQAETKGART